MNDQPLSEYIFHRLTLVLLLAVALVSGAALALYIGGNGLTRSALALGSVPAGALLALAAWRPRVSPRQRQAALLGLLALAALDAMHVDWRLEATEPKKAALHYCEYRDCAASPPLLARLAPEGETAMAGMALSSFFQLIREPEKSELTRLLRAEYTEAAADPALAALPSAPLLGLLRSDVGYQLWEPRQRGEQTPCVVFLHGFGGQLSVYVKALLDGGLGESFAVAAPLGGPTGRWWSDSEQERLLRLLDDGLPAWIDREKIYLVGLSNGAIGATATATSPAFAGRFRRVVALSGAGPVPDKLPPNTPPILFLTGRDDPRFPLARIESTQQQLAARGVESRLVTLPGDHFIILSRKHEVARAIRDWLR